MGKDEFSIAPVFSLGPLVITSTVVTTWIIMLVLAVLCWSVTRRLRIEPGPLQSAVEGVVSTIESAIDEVAPEYARRILPLVGSLWIFLVIANLWGLIPGAHSPTRDLSATAALALLVFLSTHWYGIRIAGLKRYLKHYMSPSPLLLPFHLISEITRTIALAVRLFGNMMSLEMAALLILLVAGFLAPVPILMLHVIEALVLASTVAATIAIAFGVSLPAVAMGWSISRALDALARQPEAERSIMRTLFIGLAMIESLAIYVLVIVLIVLFRNPLLQYLIQ